MLPKMGKEMNDMNFVCPRCDFPLVPVHAQERGRRRIIALTCPEPYCDHMQMLPPAAAREFVRDQKGSQPGAHRVQDAS